MPQQGPGPHRAMNFNQAVDDVLVHWFDAVKPRHLQGIFYDTAEIVSNVVEGFLAYPYFATSGGWFFSPVTSLL
jgi:hypothetical protein